MSTSFVRFVFLLALIGYSNGNLRSSTLSASWKDCTPANAVGSVKTVVFIPDPPLIDSNWTALGMGAVTETMPAGSYTLNVKDGILVNENIHGSVCDPNKVVLPANLGTVYFNGMACPVNAGAMNLTMVAYVSHLAPAGTVVSTLTAYDKPNQAGNVVVCVEVTTKIT